MSESDQPTSQPLAPFPVARAAVIVSVVSALSVAAALLVAVTFHLGASALLAIGFACLVVWLAGMLGLVPLWLLAHHGPDQTISAYLLGTGIRLGVCLLAGLVGVYGLSLAFEPMLLGLAGLYLPVLFVEVALIARYLSAADSAHRRTHGRRLNGVVV